MTAKQEKAIKDVKKRTENEELAIYETDKTGKLVLDTLANIEAKMDKHIQHDKLLEPKAVTKKENYLNAQTGHWVEIFGIGEEVGHKKRTKSNLITKETPLPILRGTAKDHKSNVDPKIGPEIQAWPKLGAGLLEPLLRIVQKSMMLNQLKSY